MDRRTFVRTTGALGGAAIVPGLPQARAAWAAMVPRDRLDRIGLQLYTVRSLMQVSVEKTLAQVADVGYKEVEFAGYFNRPPRAIKQLLDDNSISSPSAHIGMDIVRGRWSRSLADAAEIGHKYLVIASPPASDIDSIESIKRLADTLGKAADDAKEYKIKLAYHNHDDEFRLLNGRRIYDLLLENTKPAQLGMEMDVYWMVKGGVDPLTYFVKWPDRFPMLHVKDAGPPPTFQMTDVGKGTIDWKAIFSRRKEAGVKHFFVEFDDPPDPMATIKASYNYLKNLEF
ncbi:MAG TPA: sugar phosphate isomerase/epimerase [Gemmatimonadales bacterium]|nr:sugar phosphate isomerase/epimerase [Gemmatimonadales bacterium]